MNNGGVRGINNRYSKESLMFFFLIQKSPEKFSPSYKNKAAPIIRMHEVHVVSHHNTSNADYKINACRKIALPESESLLSIFWIFSGKKIRNIKPNPFFKFGIY